MAEEGGARRHDGDGRYADDVGCSDSRTGKRPKSFWRNCGERVRKFGLELHPEKTRLIEFGRYAAERRAKRGEGKPETSNFLGFTHISVGRITRRGTSHEDIRERAERQAPLHGHRRVPLREHAAAHRPSPHLRDRGRARQIQEHEGIQRHLPDGDTRHRDAGTCDSEEDGGEGPGAHRELRFFGVGDEAMAKMTDPLFIADYFARSSRRDARCGIQHGLEQEVRHDRALLQQVHRLGLWIYMMISAYQGKQVELPVIGALARKQAGA